MQSLGRRGQVVIPSLFIFPSLFLFIFLIYETAKLSQEKIRHQFAIDAAAFVEMTNYSDFLNRSAYVNGAFPMRIFDEGFSDTYLDCLGKDPNCKGKRPMDDIMFADGVFPRSESNESDPNATPKKPSSNSKSAFDDADTQWDIAYGGDGKGKNSNPPDIPGTLTIISQATAEYWNINWDDSNSIYHLYVQIFQLLGSVESAQYSVLDRLAKDHSFLNKSYWLNTASPNALSEAGGAVQSFKVSSSGFKSSVEFHCVPKLNFYGNQLTGSFTQPYKIVEADPHPEMPDTIPECSGLFQLVTVKKSMIQSMSTKGSGEYPGWEVQTVWQVSPQNYFNVDLNNMLYHEDDGPRIHATVSVGGFGSKASVWPYPTPKYQVRLYP